MSLAAIDDALALLSRFRDGMAAEVEINRRFPALLASLAATPVPQAAPQETGPELHASPPDAPAAHEAVTAASAHDEVADHPAATSDAGTFDRAETAAPADSGDVAIAPRTAPPDVGTFAPRVTRADAVLSVLTDAPQRHRQIADAAARLGVPLGSVGAALSELLRRGLAAQDGDGRYFRVGNEPRSAKLPHGELQRRVLVSLAAGMRHRPDIVAACNTTEPAVDAALQVLKGRGLVESPMRAYWRLTTTATTASETDSGLKSGGKTGNAASPVVESSTCAISQTDPSCLSAEGQDRQGAVVAGAVDGEIEHEATATTATPAPSPETEPCNCKDNDCDDGDACAKDREAAAEDRDTAPPDEASPGVQREVCLGRPAATQSSDGAAPTTTATPSPATTATATETNDPCTNDDCDDVQWAGMATTRATTAAHASPLPRGELTRRLLAELAPGPAHRVTLFGLGGSPESVTMALARLRKQGQVEPRGNGVWAPTAAQEPATLMAPPPSAPPEPPPRPRIKGKRRSVTLNRRYLSRDEKAAGAELASVDTTNRPRTRADCVPHPIECPWCCERVTMEVKSNGATGATKSSDRPDRAAVRPPDGSSSRRIGAQRRNNCTNMAGALRLRDGEDGTGTAIAAWTEELRLHSQAARDVRDARIWGVAQHEGPLHAAEDAELPELRRTGHHGMSAMGGELPVLLRGHGATPVGGAFTGSDRQRRELRTKQLSMGDEGGAGEEQAHVACPRCGGRVRFHRGVGEADGDWERHDQGASPARLEPRESAEYARALNHCRPCIRVSCTHHLAIDVDRATGSIKVNFPGVVDGDLSQMTDTCALDVADRGGVTLEGVADVLNITRERTGQIEAEALEHMKGRRGVSADDARGLGMEA